MKKFFETPVTLLWLFIILTLIIRLIIAYTTGLGVGEAYYFRGAVDLQLSYFDQPPLFFWISSVFVKLMGLTNLALRLPAVIFFSGTTLLIYLTTRKLFDEWSAFWAAFIINLSFVFTWPVAVWYQPDAPLMFFWMLSIYCLVNLFFIDFSESVKQSKISIYFLFVLFGISVGLASLSKYHSIFLILGTILFLVLNKQFRHWLTHPGLYLSAAIALAFVIPVVLWNQDNNWASISFQGNRALPSNLKLRPQWLVANIIGQALWLGPWIWYPLFKELIKSVKLFRSDSRYSFIMSLSILPIVSFTLLALWSDSQFHFHWQAPGYMILFVPLGFSIAMKLKQEHRRKRTKRWLFLSSIVLVLISAGAIVQMNTGIWQKYGPREIALNFGGYYDPTLEGYDFDQIQERFDEKGWVNNDSLFVGTVKWWQTGKVDWALKGEKQIVVFGNDPRNYAFFSKPKDLIGYDAVVVRFISEESTNQILPFFDKIEQVDDIIIERNGVEELVLQVFYCKNFRVPENYAGTLPLYKQLVGVQPLNNSPKKN